MRSADAVALYHSIVKNNFPHGASLRELITSLGEVFERIAIAVPGED